MYINPTEPTIRMYCFWLFLCRHIKRVNVVTSSYFTQHTSYAFVVIFTEISDIFIGVSLNLNKFKRLKKVCDFACLKKAKHQNYVHLQITGLYRRNSTHLFLAASPVLAGRPGEADSEGFDFQRWHSCYGKKRQCSQSSRLFCSLNITRVLIHLVTTMSILRWWQIISHKNVETKQKYLETFGWSKGLLMMEIVYC